MQTHLDSLRRSAGALPELPGVYFWKDANGRILYIGKAVNLRSRVMSYFSAARRQRRVRELVTRARSIEHEVAANELEALFRESSLIKQVQPPFNRALRRPRELFYLRLEDGTADTHLEIARGDQSGDLVFGPFRTRALAREVLQFVHDVLPLKKCRAVKPRCRPCMYFQMHRCAAPALDDLHRRQHQEAIQQLEYLLDGRTDLVMRWLVGKRDRLSDALLFERAADIQLRIDALQQLIDRQLILDAALHARCVLVRHQQRDR
ncbi:MAG TPA: GIY-YIG nuclease family protein, partial [Chloroflexota bacterium]|nr:GIY-YIG nuclease family protein [Chloroflexota bacterium]